MIPRSTGMCFKLGFKPFQGFTGLNPLPHGPLRENYSDRSSRQPRMWYRLGESAGREESGYAARRWERTGVTEIASRKWQAERNRKWRMVNWKMLKLTFDTERSGWSLEVWRADDMKTSYKWRQRKAAVERKAESRKELEGLFCILINDSSIVRVSVFYLVESHSSIVLPRSHAHTAPQSWSINMTPSRSAQLYSRLYWACSPPPHPPPASFSSTRRGRKQSSPPALLQLTERKWT